MGSIIGKEMRKNMEEQQAFMLESQRAQMERQMAMQAAMQQRAMAAQLGRARDMFHWWAAFFATYTVVAAAGVRASGRKGPLVPLLPLTFIVGYQADLAYGGKIERIRRMAEKMLEEEKELFLLPKGMPTFEEIDARRGGKQ